MKKVKLGTEPPNDFFPHSISIVTSRYMSHLVRLQAEKCFEDNQDRGYIETRRMIAIGRSATYPQLGFQNY